MLSQEEVHVLTFDPDARRARISRPDEAAIAAG